MMNIFLLLLMFKGLSKMIKKELCWFVSCKGNTMTLVNIYVPENLMFTCLSWIGGGSQQNGYTFCWYQWSLFAESKFNILIKSKLYNKV